jgi:hypothetical protein
MRRLELLVEDVGGVAAAEEEIAIQANEIAVDVLALHRRLDEVDRRAVALRGDAAGVHATRLLQRREAIVERVRQMRRRPTGLAAPHLLLVEHDDALAGDGERIRHAESGDAGTDDTDVGREVLAEWGAFGNAEGVAPDGVRLLLGHVDDG